MSLSSHYFHFFLLLIKRLLWFQTYESHFFCCIQYLDIRMKFFRRSSVRERSSLLLSWARTFSSSGIRWMKTVWAVRPYFLFRIYVYLRQIQYVLEHRSSLWGLWTEEKSRTSTSQHFVIPWSVSLSCLAIIHLSVCSAVPLYVDLSQVHSQGGGGGGGPKLPLNYKGFFRSGPTLKSWKHCL